MGAHVPLCRLPLGSCHGCPNLSNLTSLFEMLFSHAYCPCHVSPQVQFALDTKHGLQILPYRSKATPLLVLPPPPPLLPLLLLLC